jgi:hypothetical protein
METLIVQLITFAVCCFVLGIIGMAVGDLANKRNGKIGFWLGALLGPVGWIIVAIQPPAAEKEAAVKTPRRVKEKTPVDSTMLVLGGLVICSVILIALLVFGHFVTKF